MLMLMWLTRTYMLVDRALGHELNIATTQREEAMSRAEAAEGQVEELMAEIDAMRHDMDEKEQQHVQKQARQVQTDDVTAELEAENTMLHDELLKQKAELEHATAAQQDDTMRLRSTHAHVMESWREDKSRLEAYIEAQAAWIEHEQKERGATHEQMEMMMREANKGQRDFDFNRAGKRAWKHTLWQCSVENVYVGCACGLQG